jgi:hypothetical protein
MIIVADVERSLGLLASLEGSSFKPLFDDVADLVRHAFVLPVRHRVTNVRVDLALGLSGFEQQAVGRAESLDLAGVTVSVASAEDLLIMKVLAGRPQDDQDVRGLVIAQGERLDWEYCLHLAAELSEALGQDLVGRISTLRSTLSES